MTNTIPALLEELRRRNDELATAYRNVSRRTLSRSLTTLAASAADQRKELGKTLADLADHLHGSEAMAGLPELPQAASPSEAAASTDPGSLLRYFRDIEEGDRQFFAALAGLPGLDVDLSARLAALSEEARKRAAIANGHLDRLSLG